VRSQPCPIVRTWDDLERSIWAGFTCATVEAADTPIQIPHGAEPYDFSRFTVYVKGTAGGPALLDAQQQLPDGLQTFASPVARGTGRQVDIAISADGRIVEFRSTELAQSIAAVEAWSRENTATIQERFERLEPDQDERGWLIRLYLTPPNQQTQQLPRA